VLLTVLFGCSGEIKSGGTSKTLKQISAENLLTAVETSENKPITGIVKSSVLWRDKLLVVTPNKILQLDSDYTPVDLYTSFGSRQIISVSASGSELHIFETDGFGTYYITIDMDNAGEGEKVFVLEQGEIASYSLHNGNNIIAIFSNEIRIYNNDGSKKFSLTVRGFIADIINTKSEDIYILTQSGLNPVLYKIDIVNKSLTKIASLPDFKISVALYQGGAEYDMMFRSDAKLYGLNLASDECVFIADLMKSDIDPISISSMVELPSGKSVCFVADSDFQQSSIYELTDKEIEKTKTELTLALFNSELSDSLLAMVAKWNRANSDYRINIIQYGSGTGYYSYDGVFDSSDGYDKFALDIAAGNIPDIIDVSALPVQTLVSKGLLDDLYPYVDKDIELNREDFYPNILKALEIDGGLYQTLSGTTLTVAYTDGDVPYLTASETANLFKKSGKKYFTNAVDKWFLKEEFCAYYADDFVDWTIGQCSFDSDEFISALELLKLMQPENYVAEENAEYFLTQEALYMMRIARETPLWHGGISITGMPARNGSGNILHGAGQQLAISSSSKHKDAAWSFVRTMLTEEYQNSFYIPCFRTHIAAQENGFAKIMSFEEDKDTIALLNQRYEIMMNVYTSTDKLYRVNSHLYDIIVEEALGYLAGDKTAEETAAVIQSRASLYVAEQR
jgi:ABC-type glycerol-3-phosphate transport system substrate-binding protein